MSHQFIICGFHRSGTSMSAQALQHAGLYLGESLIEANPSNPDGHFEDIETVNMHDKWLALNDTDWCHFDKLPVIDKTMAKADLASVIARFNRCGHHWGIKDPRASLFLSQWHSALNKPIVVMAYRHFASCVDSLRRRQASELLLKPSIDNQAVRFWQDSELALRSWLLHNQALLAHQEKYPDTCLLLSQEAQVHGESLISHINHRFELSLDENAATGIDIRKTSIQKNIRLPMVSLKLRIELESTWQKLQAIAVSPASQHAQVLWRSATQLSASVLDTEMVSLWNQLDIPIPVDTDDNTDEPQPATDISRSIKHEQVINATSVVTALDATNQYQRSQIHTVIRQLPQVEQIPFLESLLERLPHDTFINGLLGKQYWSLGQLEKAETCLTLGCKEKDHSTWFHLGLLRLQQERLKDALEAFECGFAIQANPDHTVVLIRTCITMEDIDKAVSYSQQGAQIFPEDHRFISLNADVLCLQDRCEDALQLCLSQEHETNDTMLLFKGFQILTSLGRTENANLLYNKATIRSLRNQLDYRVTVLDVLNQLPQAEACELQNLWKTRLRLIANEHSSGAI